MESSKDFFNNFGKDNVPTDISQEEVDKVFNVLKIMQKSAGSKSMTEMDIDELKYVVNNIQTVTNTLTKMIVEIIVVKTGSTNKSDILQLIKFLVDVAGMAGGVSFADFSATEELSKQFKE